MGKVRGASGAGGGYCVSDNGVGIYFTGPFSSERFKLLSPPDQHTALRKPHWFGFSSFVNSQARTRTPFRQGREGEEAPVSAEHS